MAKRWYFFNNSLLMARNYLLIIEIMEPICLLTMQLNANMFCWSAQVIDHKLCGKTTWWNFWEHENYLWCLATGNYEALIIMLQSFDSLVLLKREGNDTWKWYFAFNEIQKLILKAFNKLVSNFQNSNLRWVYLS